MTSSLQDLARDVAVVGGQLAAEAFRDRPRTVASVTEKDGHFDIVTEADARVERLVVDRILSGAPSSRVLGEEGGWYGEGELTWLIDPIDGTSNFASGLPIFATSVAALRDTQPLAAAVHEPVLGATFHTAGDDLLVDGTAFHWPEQSLRTRDVEILTNAPYERSGLPDSILDSCRTVLDSFRAVRRLGACTLHLAYVAAGWAAATYEYEFHPWDVAAGLQLAAASGCEIVAWDAAGQVLSDPVGHPMEVDRVLVTAPGLDCSHIDWARPT